MLSFTATDDQRDKIMEWLRIEVWPKVVAHQQETHLNPDHSRQFCWDQGQPYEGAIGGGLTYEFTPTSLGVVLVATYDAGFEKFQLNVTDYGSW